MVKLLLLVMDKGKGEKLIDTALSLLTLLTDSCSHNSCSPAFMLCTHTLIEDIIKRKKGTVYSPALVASLARALSHFS